MAGGVDACDVGPYAISADDVNWHAGLLEGSNDSIVREAACATAAEAQANRLACEKSRQAREIAIQIRIQKYTFDAKFFNATLQFNLRSLHILQRQKSHPKKSPRIFAYHTCDKIICQPRSFRLFVKMIREGRAPVAFVSGDRHLAEVSVIDAKEVGFATAELTTSAIHARTFPDAWKKAPNPRQAVGISGKLNYAIIDVEAAHSLRAKMSVWGFGKTKFFEHDLDVKRGDG